MIHPADALRLIVDHGVEPAETVDPEFLEGAVVLAHLPVIGAGEGLVAPAAGLGLPDSHDPVGLGIGERAQRQSLEHAEDGHVGTDTDSQDQDRHRGEAGRGTQSAQGVNGILLQGIEEIRPPRGLSRVLSNADLYQMYHTRRYALTSQPLPRRAKRVE
jgi:hypothetical protein